MLEPHPDDAVLSMGGTLSAYSCDENSQLLSLVLFMQEGENGKTRKLESDYIWNTLLHGEVRYANLPDSSYETGDLGEFRITKESKQIFRKCQDEIRLIIESYVPSIVYFPMGIGEHFHHLLINACFSVFSRYRGIRFCFYEDYPYSDYGRRTYIKPLYNMIKRYRIRKIYNNIEMHLSQKAECIMEYRSQHQKNFHEIYEGIRLYGEAIGYEGFIEEAKIDAGLPYERIWEIINEWEGHEYAYEL